MFGTQDLAVFIVAGLLLNLTPGADTLYIVSRSAAQGARAGAVAALGVGAGCLVHVLATALGISAILAASATAFAVVKLIGAAYLCYLGATLLLARPRPGRDGPATTSPAPASSAPASSAPASSAPASSAPASSAPASSVSASPAAPALGGDRLRAVFWQGFLTNMLNPKVALFFLAFLPQFIASDAPVKWLSLLFLGLLFDLNGTLWNLLVAWAAARASTRLPASSALAVWLRRACGGVFVWFGIRLLRDDG
ncbi:MAG: LysE family translocator [Lautropia sp.]